MEQDHLITRWISGRQNPNEGPFGYSFQGAFYKNATSSALGDAPPGLTFPRNVQWTLEGYLEHLNIDTLMKSIAEYKRSARNHQTRPQVRRALWKVLKGNDSPSVVLPFRTSIVPEGVLLHRARKISEPGVIETQDDVWMAPPSYVGLGRFNDAGESLFYASRNGATALHEVRAKPGDIIAVSQFRVTQTFSTMDLSVRIEEPTLSFLSQRKLKLLLNFIEGVFTQEIPSEASHRYIAPDLLAKEIFGIQGNNEGWTYRSVADKNRENISAVNVCIRGESARSLVKYVGTDIVHIEAKNLYLNHPRLVALGPASGSRTLRKAICIAALPKLVIPTEAAVALSTSVRSGLAELVTLEGRRHESQAGEESYQKVLAKAPPTPLAELGLRYKEQGKIAEAEEFFRSSSNAGSALGAVYLGILLAERDDNTEAEKCFRFAADRKSAYGLRCLGVLLARLGRVAEAESAYREAAAQGDLQSMSNLGASLYGRKHFKQAEPFFRQAAERGSTHAMYGLARILSNRGQMDQAEVLVRAAAEQKEPQSMGWLGMSLYKEGETEEGIRLLRAAALEGDDMAQNFLGTIQMKPIPDTL